MTNEEINTRLAEIFKKYFAGLNEENGRLFMDFECIDPSDCAYLLSLINKEIL